MPAGRRLDPVPIIPAAVAGAAPVTEDSAIEWRCLAGSGSRIACALQAEPHAFFSPSQLEVNAICARSVLDLFARPT